MSRLIYRRREGDQNDIWMFDPDPPADITITPSGMPVATNVMPAYTNLTKGVGQNFNPVWRPGHQEIAFTSFRDGAWSIYALHVGDPPARRIIAGTPDRPCGEPAWSPDGSRIAYVQYQAPHPSGQHWNNASGKLCIANPDGSEIMELVDEGRNYMSHVRHPSWSPDGRSIVFDYDCNLAAVDRIVSRRGRLAGTFRILLILGTVGETSRNPSWGNAGIVFQNGTGRRREVWLVGPDGTAPQAITALGRRDVALADPCWHPDGQVTFARYAGDELSGLERREPRPGPTLLDRTLWTVSIGSSGGPPPTPEWAFHSRSGWSWSPVPAPPLWDRSYPPIPNGVPRVGCFEPDWQHPVPPTLDELLRTVDPEIGRMGGFVVTRPLVTWKDEPGGPMP